jgi:hypothetical protein
MPDESDKKWWERRLREGPPDWGYVCVAVATVAVSFGLQRVLFPDAPRYVWGFIALGVIFVYSVYRLVTFDK